MKEKKTFEEHVQYLHESARLMLFFSFGWNQRRGGGIRDVIAKKTLILEMTGVKADAIASDSLLGLLEDVFLRCEGRAEDFENKGFDSIRGLVDRAAPVSYELDAMPPKGYNAGSLKYDAPLGELPPNHCNFHISNAVCPASIFDDPAYLPRCFTELMDKSEKEHGYDVLRTFTWLNSHPRWLALFPAEWHENLGEPYEDVADNLGFWGQILTARKTLNAKTAEHMRKNFEMKYKPRASSCSFASMRRHLAGLGVAG